MKNVDVDYKDIVIGRQGGNGHNHISFFNVLINLATYTIFKQKKKIKFWAISHKVYTSEKMDFPLF